MKSEVKVFARENEEIQRVQAVYLDEWSQLDFLRLKQETVEQQVRALQCFADIYQNYLVPACPWMFSKMMMFCLPEDIDIWSYVEKSENQTDVYESARYGKIKDSLTIATILLQEGITIRGKKVGFKNKTAEKFN